jgi:hypothetical protein
MGSRCSTLQLCNIMLRAIILHKMLQSMSR